MFDSRVARVRDAGFVFKWGAEGETESKGVIFLTRACYSCSCLFQLSAVQIFMTTFDLFSFSSHNHGNGRLLRSPMDEFH
jgi:hypothetical protein